MTNLTKAIHWHIFHKKFQLCLLVDWWSLPPGDRLGALASPPRSTTQTTSSTVGGLPVRWEEIGWEHPNLSQHHRLPRSGGWTREDAGFVEIRGTRLLLGRKRAEAPLEGGSLSAGLSSWLMLFSGRIKYWSWNRVYFFPRCYNLLLQVQCWPEDLSGCGHHCQPQGLLWVPCLPSKQPKHSCERRLLATASFAGGRRHKVRLRTRTGN